MPIAYGPCAYNYIVTGKQGSAEHVTSPRRYAIRSFGVGLLALATVAAAGIFLRRRRHAPARLSTGRTHTHIDQLYAAGM